MNPPTIHPILGVPTYEKASLLKLKEKGVPVTAPGENETAIFRNVLAQKELCCNFPSITTVQEMIANSVKHFGKFPFLGTRYPIEVKGQTTWSDYQYKTYAEFDVDRREFGAGMMNIHSKYVGDQSQWLIGIYSINRYEWMVADMGAGLYSIANVALYDTLGPETSEFIINHSELPLIVTSVDKVSVLLELAPKCPKLKVIIVMESLFKNQPSPLPILEKWGAQVGIKVISFSNVMKIGKANPLTPKLPKPADLLCISYTSGTTGNPKGAMLSHRNMIATIRAACYSVLLDTSDCHISYLPMAHIFERVLINCIAVNGSAAGFFRGDVTLLVEDIGVLKPTFFASVPRLLNRIHDKIVQGALHSGSSLKAALFTKALESKLYYLHEQGSLTHAIWDKLVFKKVKEILGGRLKYIMTASAPISSKVIDFLRVACSVDVIEAYGQTESCGGLTVTVPGDVQPGHVGGPFPNSEVKLVSVPEMNYHAKDMKGEVWVRGPGVFMGYLKDKAKTDETITTDGWLQTGDIGTIDKLGRLTIIDRKKNIFKLAQGEYVAPEKLENIFLKSPFVAQIYVHGDSLQSELVGIVVPDQEFGITYGISKGLLPANTVVPPPPVPNQPPHPLIVELSKNPKFQQAIFNDITALGKTDKIRGFEFLKAIYVEPVMFSAESGLLTPTFKLKRPAAAEMYRTQIDQMYKELDAKRPPPSKL